MQFRQFLQDQIAAIERLLNAGDLAPNLKTAYTALRDQFKAALQGLPGEGNPALDSAAVATVLAGFGSSLSSLNTAVAGQAEAIHAQWQARVTAGEFVPKDRHAQLCTEAVEAARSAGIAQGKKDAETEFNAKLGAERKANERAAAIVRNGLPPAPDDVLRLDDEAFATREKDAKTRVEQTKAAGIETTLKFVGRYAWAPAAEAEALAEVVQAGKKGGGVNPLAAGAGSNAVPDLQFAL